MNRQPNKHNCNVGFTQRCTKAESFYYVNYGLSIITVKSQSNNLSNENINTDVSVVFKTKRELKCQNELFLKYNFSGNTSVYVFITEII